VAVIEFARSVLGLEDADSTEFNAATPHPTVVFMPEISTKHMVRGGSLLGGVSSV
jgi:CTP synthase